MCKSLNRNKACSNSNPAFFLCLKAKKMEKQQCHLQQKKLDVMVSSWADEVTEILTQRSTEEVSFV